jgi:hypothetical protein
MLISFLEALQERATWTFHSRTVDFAPVNDVIPKVSKLPDSGCEVLQGFRQDIKGAIDLFLLRKEADGSEIVSTEALSCLGVMNLLRRWLGSWRSTPEECTCRAG